MAKTLFKNKNLKNDLTQRELKRQGIKKKDLKKKEVRKKDNKKKETAAGNLKKDRTGKETSKGSLKTREGKKETSKDSLKIRESRKETSKDSLKARESRKETSKDSLKARESKKETSKDSLKVRESRNKADRDSLKNRETGRKAAEERKYIGLAPGAKKSPEKRQTRHASPAEHLFQKALSADERNGRGLRLKKNRDKEENRGKAPSVKIIPLGGLEQIGMNITAFEYGDSIVVVDCGLAFPEDDMFGIDLVIPDTTYLEENIDKVKGFVITHGHEDHIGALPYVLKKINVPIYGTRLTMGIIENKLREHNLLGNTERHVVSFGDVVTLGDFQVEFIKTNHSIVDAAALAITSPAGVIVHTGDFKVDYTPVYGDAIDLQRFAELGRQGVLALLCDSTNSMRPGHTPSEKAVGRSIDQIFRDHPDTRLIVATFASNVDRVQQIINYAYKYGRKVVVEGRSMVNIIDTATKLDVLNIPENTLIDIDQLKNYPGDKTVIITTGSQGESMAALSRMADGLHRKVTIGPNDTVIFSSSPIPGNEKAVTGVINKLVLKGADVISQDVHASGHPCQEDVKLIYHLVQPRYAIPVHGEFRHLKAQAKLLRDLGYKKDDIFILGSGDVLEISEDGAAVREKVQVGNILVDGLGVGDVGNVVLRDRQHLAEDGIVIIVFALESGSCRLVSGPEITSRGFVYIKEADNLMTGAAAVAEDAILQCQESGATDWNRYKNAVKDSLSDFFWKKTERRPVILPMILEV